MPLVQSKRLQRVKQLAERFRVILCASGFDVGLQISKLLRQPTWRKPVGVVIVQGVNEVSDRVDCIPNNFFIVLIANWLWAHVRRPLQHLRIRGAEDHTASPGNVGVRQSAHPDAITALDSQAPLALFASLAAARILASTNTTVRQIVGRRFGDRIEAQQIRSGKPASHDPHLRYAFWIAHANAALRVTDKHGFKQQFGTGVDGQGRMQS